MNRFSFFLTVYSLFVVMNISCGHSHDAGHDHEHDHEHEETVAGHAHEHEEAVAAHEEHGEHEGDETELTAEQQKRIGIATMEVATKAFRGVIKVGGTIVTSPTDAATLVAPASGQIRLAGNLVEGAKVRSGQTLFTINTEALSETSNATRTSLALEATTKRLERAKSLIAERFITQKEYDETEAAYTLALAEHKAATSRGGSASSVGATMDGFVTALMVRSGDYVTAGQALATVTRGQSMLLRAEVPERHFANLSDIVSARFKPSYTDKVYDIDSLGGYLMAREAAAQQNGGYLSVTFSFRGAGSLVAGCYTDVWLLTRDRHDALCVPTGALVREGELSFVFIQEDATCFIKREVRLGESNGAETEVLAGIEAGDKIVVAGAPQLAIAASARVIPGHSHNH